MNRTLPAFLLAMLLIGGCGKPGNTPAADVPVGETGDEAVSTPPPAPTAADPVVAATNDSGVVPTLDDDTAINASIDRLLGGHAKYQAVIEAYQQAVTRGDKAAVAALVDYPIQADIDGRKTAIRDASAFVRDYDKIVTPAIARTIEAQKYSELLVNSKGVMFGNGETWINGICKQGSADCSEFEVKVVTIQAGASN